MYYIQYWHSQYWKTKKICVTVKANVYTTTTINVVKWCIKRFIYNLLSKQKVHGYGQNICSHVQQPISLHSSTRPPGTDYSDFLQNRNSQHAKFHTWIRIRMELPHWKMKHAVHDNLIYRADLTTPSYYVHHKYSIPFTQEAPTALHFI